MANTIKVVRTGDIGADGAALQTAIDTIEALLPKQSITQITPIYDIDADKVDCIIIYAGPALT